MSRQCKENQVISELYGQEVFTEGPIADRFGAKQGVPVPDEFHPDGNAGIPSPRLTQDPHYSKEMMEVNDVTVTLAGNRLTIESHHGDADVDLTPDQFEFLKKQWPALGKQDKSA